MDEPTEKRIASEYVQCKHLFEHNGHWWRWRVGMVWWWAWCEGVPER